MHRYFSVRINRFTSIPFYRYTVIPLFLPPSKHILPGHGKISILIGNGGEVPPALELFADAVQYPWIFDVGLKEFDAGRDDITVRVDGKTQQQIAAEVGIEAVHSFEAVFDIYLIHFHDG